MSHWAKSFYWAATSIFLTRGLFRSIVLFAFAALLMASNGVPEQTVLSKALDQLDSLHSVDGYAVGASGTPGRFYTLYKIIVRLGDKNQCLALIRDKSAVSRCMGLYCMAHSNGVNPALTLLGCLSDSELVSYDACGCMVTHISVGNFAWNILLNRDVLERTSKSIPLISEERIHDVAIKSLANDSLWHLHAACREELSRYLLSSGDTLSLGSLRAKFPGVYSATVIKSIGRLEPDIRIKEFLIACSKNPALDKLSKMTAWSALTRYSSDDVYELVGYKQDELEVLSAGFGHIIKDEIVARRRHVQDMIPVNEEHTWMGMEKIEDKVLAAFSMSDPVAFDDLQGAFGYAIVNDHENVRSAVVNALIELSRKSKKYRQVWCTYSDIGYRLHNFVCESRANGLKLVSEGECSVIESNIN